MITFFIFVFMIQLVKPAEKPITPGIIAPSRLQLSRADRSDPAREVSRARWKVSGIFFVLGLFPMIWWMPKLEIYPSLNAAAPPPPMG